MNLIEQQNVLKSLTDEKLQQELASPSGATPPFLLATELSRRQEMRKSYEGEKARQGKSSTVLEDLLGGPRPSVTGGMQPAAPQQQPQMPAGPMLAPGAEGIAAFADGGLVTSGGGLDYARLEDMYLEQINARPEREKRARALALLSASAGIMSGGSSNFFTNIGKGIAPAVNMYGEQLENIDTDERAALRDAMDLERIRNAEELQRMEFGWRQQRAGEEDALTREGWAHSRRPAAVSEALWYANEATPEERAAYDKPASVRPTDLPKAIDDTFESAEKMVPDVDQQALMLELGRMPTAQEIAEAERERYRKVEILTYERLRNAYGADVAKEYAARVGLTDGDLLTGGGTSSDPATNAADPLNLGL